MKQYVDLNTNRQTNATNDFEKDFFNLINNTVFGKTMKNARNRVDIKLVNSKVKAKKLAAKPSFQHYNTFDENLIVIHIHMKKIKLVFNKPVYLGMCILHIRWT